MPKPSPSLYAAAVLIWLPRGELPDIGGFDTTKVQPPPTTIRTRGGCFMRRSPML
jgi:hypothetical protein